MSTITQTMVSQIDYMTILATSGGRILVDEKAAQIHLPVRYGYRVLVTYDHGSDTYTVERVFVRKGEFFDHGRETWVHAPELSDSVYRAGCYHHPYGEAA